VVAFYKDVDDRADVEVVCVRIAQTFPFMALPLLVTGLSFLMDGSKGLTRTGLIALEYGYCILESPADRKLPSFHHTQLYLSPFEKAR
jgi:hypothetical protein